MNNTTFTSLASDSRIKKAQNNLLKNGITVYIAENAEEARKKIHDLIPEGSEVMTATSRTLDALDIEKEINESGRYNSVKAQLIKLNRETDSLKMQKLGAAPEYVIGSVHAVTEDGKVMIASNTGSQLSSYVYGALHVVWVVSTKKIVKDEKEGRERIFDYVLPIEDKRLKGQYGPQAVSAVRKLLIVNSEINKSRISLIFVKEDLGF